MIKFAHLCHIITNRFNDYEDAGRWTMKRKSKKVLLVIRFYEDHQCLNF
jgi:hypothetical protein